MKRMIKRSPIPAVGKRTPFGVLIIINLYILWYKKSGSIINVGVTPLQCHFQHYFFAKK